MNGRLRRLCHDVAQELSASGAGVSVITADGVTGLMTASDAPMHHLVDRQVVFGEGPCVDAHATSRPVLIPDLAAVPADRWPVYAPAMWAAGVRAVFAFPLQVGAARLGVLEVFRDRTGGLSQRELSRAFLAADRVVNVLLDGQDQARRDADGLAGAALDRAEVFQAQGMVMMQLGVPIVDALVRMRAYAYAEDRDLGAVAADIVARRLRLDGDPL